MISPNCETRDILLLCSSLQASTRLSRDWTRPAQELVAIASTLERRFPPQLYTRYEPLLIETPSR